MKLTKSHIASLLLMGAIFTACDDELDRPPVIVPEATIEANTSILEVKNKYWNENRNYIDTIGFNSTGEHIIVSGRIISSDETGNIYKNLVIQDETAALTISINENDMFESYHIGQEVVIDLTDMYIGKYNGLQQLGFPEYSSQYGWEATFMEMDFFQQHAQFNGLPETDKIDTLTVDIAQLEAIKSNADSLQRWQSQLVRFNNVQWVEAGKPYSEASASTNRYIKDANGNKMLVRNSSYATFRDKLLPSGTGSVVGILSFYGSGWQVLLRSTDDCIGFDESTTPDTPSETSTYKKVTSITSGKEYLLVADGKAATALSSAYGYLKVIDVTDNNGVIEVAEGNGFTITETTGGYTITDANSKYLYMKGTYNSFNVDTSLPSEGGVWTATPQADGSFIITNATMNKSIQYDAQYDSYGAYSDVRGTMPTLYEKTN